MSWDHKVNEALQEAGIPAEYSRLALGVIAEQKLLADRQGYNRAKNDDCYQFKGWLDKIIDKLDPDMRLAEIVELREQLIRERAKYGMD